MDYIKVTLQNQSYGDVAFPDAVQRTELWP